MNLLPWTSERLETNGIRSMTIFVTEYKSMLATRYELSRKRRNQDPESKSNPPNQESSNAMLL